MKRLERVAKYHFADQTGNYLGQGFTGEMIKDPLIKSCASLINNLSLREKRAHVGAGSNFSSSPFI